MILAGISFRMIFPKRVSPPATAVWALLTSLAINRLTSRAINMIQGDIWILSSTSFFLVKIFEMATVCVPLVPWYWHITIGDGLLSSRGSVFHNQHDSGGHLNSPVDVILSGQELSSRWQRCVFPFEWRTRRARCSRMSACSVSILPSSPVLIYMYRDGLLSSRGAVCVFGDILWTLSSTCRWIREEQCTSRLPSHSTDTDRARGAEEGRGRSRAEG